MTTSPGAQSQAVDNRGDKGRASRPSRHHWSRAALLLFIVAAAPLTAAHAQTNVSVFRAGAVTPTPQATVAADSNCPSGFVCVPFGPDFKYPIDPTCSDQHVIIGIRTEQDPATGNDVEYVRNLVFLKAGDDWTIIPLPETRAAGPDVGKPLGALLCAGKEGSR